MCCWEVSKRTGAITNDYSQPEGDGDRQVLGPAEALLIESCL